MKTNVKSIIEYWYKTLHFPDKYNSEFYNALESEEISPDVSIESYDTSCQNGIKNLLTMLYLCEKTRVKYKEKNIPEEILIDTLEDIVRWTDTYTAMDGKLSLGELPWICHHLSMNIFQIGRLQFCMEKAREDIPDRGICVGDNVIGIHIPSSGPLDTEECKKSLKRAKEFFGKFFPKYKYSYFRCHSWLLDKKLEEILKCGSNILKFQEMFEIVLSEPSDAILRYVFAWNTTRENLPFMHPVSTFAEKVKEICLAGDKFNEATGFIATCEGNET